MKNKKAVLILFALVAFAGHAQTLKEAIRLTDNEQYDAATTAFQNLLNHDALNATNYFYFGENYLLSDNADSAMLMYSKGKQVDPANALNLIGQAKYMLSKTGDAKLILGDASRLIDEAISKAGPKNALVLIESADAFIKFKNKNLDKAKLLLDKAFALDPKNPEIQILYGDIYTEIHNGTLAAEYYNKALELDKNSVKAIVSKGGLYRSSTNNEGAAEQFENAIKIDSTFAPAHRELGEVSFKLGKLEKAKSEYRKYLDLSKNNCGARIRYASFLYLSKEYTGALNEINQLKQNCDPENITLLRISSYCYYETKDYSKGIAVVQKLFSKVNPEKIIALDYEYYGRLQVANNQDSLGILQLRKAYEMENSKTDLLFEMGNAYFKLKKYTEASSVFKEKISIGKDIKAVDYFNLGRSYFYNSEFQEADTAFSKVSELLPKWPSGYIWKADSYANFDSTSQIYASNYEKFIDVTIQDTSNIPKYKSKLISSYKILSSFYFKKVPDETIIAYLKKILELDPEDNYALINLKGYQQQKKKP